MMPTGARLRIAVVATIASLLLLAVIRPASAAADDETITTTLYSGWNLVGWIHEETPASGVFEQLPELESIHGGALVDGEAADAAEPVQQLQPGRGYWFRIRDGDAVDWVRPATPAGRRFLLEPGRQLVAWAGRSNIELADALAGLAEHLTIAQRWIAAEQRSVPWPRDPSLEPVDIPALRRGEAIEVTLTEATEWLQPSGVYHRVAFAGGLQHRLPDDFRETVEADVAWVVELFASRFAWEMETRRLTVRIATTPEALARLQSRQGATTDAWARSPVTRAGVNEIVMSAGFWTSGYTSATGMSQARSVLAHEYFHIAQFEIAGPARHRTPGWLTEGTATWLGQGLLGRLPTVSEAHFWTTELNLATRFRPSDQAHALGVAALTILIERSGTDSVIDFWRNLAPRKGVARSWQTAFRETFGLSSQEFYELFYDVRRPHFTIISGAIKRSGAAALPRLSVVADSDRGRWQPVDVERDGSFEITLPRFDSAGLAPLNYGISVVRPDTTCRGEVGPDQMLTWPTSGDSRAPKPFATSEPSVSDFNIVAPASFCREQVRVRTTGNIRDVPKDLEVSVCRPNGTGCTEAEQRRGSRTYTATVPIPGDHVIALITAGSTCPTYVAADGLTRDVNQAMTVASASRPSVVAVEFDASVRLCDLAIRGQLLGRDSEWMRGRLINFYPIGGGRPTIGQLQADGSFTAHVAEVGTYRFTVSAPGRLDDLTPSCNIVSYNPQQWASRETTPALSGEHIRVTGDVPASLQWEIHPGACRYTVEGRVVDRQGLPVASWAFLACPRKGVCQNVRTDASGDFVFAATNTGEMILQPRVRNCGKLQIPRQEHSYAVRAADDNYVEWVVSGYPCAP